MLKHTMALAVMLTLSAAAVATPPKTEENLQDSVLQYSPRSAVQKAQNLTKNANPINMDLDEDSDTEKGTTRPGYAKMIILSIQSGWESICIKIRSIFSW